jgi:hypothetical protein
VRVGGGGYTGEGVGCGGSRVRVVGGGYTGEGGGGGYTDEGRGWRVHG